MTDNPQPPNPEERKTRADSQKPSEQHPSDRQATRTDNQQKKPDVSAADRSQSATSVEKQRLILQKPDVSAGGKPRLHRSDRQATGTDNQAKPPSDIPGKSQPQISDRQATRTDNQQKMPVVASDKSGSAASDAPVDLVRMGKDYYYMSSEDFRIKYGQIAKGYGATTDRLSSDEWSALGSILLKMGVMPYQQQGPEVDIDKNYWRARVIEDLPASPLAPFAYLAARIFTDNPSKQVAAMELSSHVWDAAIAAGSVGVARNEIEKTARPLEDPNRNVGETPLTEPQTEPPPTTEGNKPLARNGSKQPSAAGGGDAPSSASKPTIEWRLPKEAVEKVPKEWAPVEAANKKVGLRWQDPQDKGSNIRIDRGDPSNSLPSQQVDHVVLSYRGKVIDRSGNPIQGSIKDNATKVHIPLTEWLQWRTWYHP